MKASHSSNQFTQAPHVISDTRLHGWRHAQLALNPEEIIVREMERKARTGWLKSGRERQLTCRLVKRLEKLGHEVILRPAAG